jgi:archaemetzincin
MKTIFLIFILSAYGNFAPSNNDKVIIIQPFGGFSNNESKLVYDQIKKMCPKVVLRKSIPFPANSFYKPRNRYRADSLIRFLSSTIGKDSVIVGLTQKDISARKGKIKDWGVMGLGYCPGNSCIVSSFRLSQKNKTEQFHKVALHELGHTQGLSHCKNKTCLMQDAKGGNPFDNVMAFCLPCKNYLKTKNWKLL